jgi:hypothetical protein
MPSAIMPDIHYDLVDHSLLSLMISIQQIAFQASASNCPGTREFIFALDAYTQQLSAEIIRQGTPEAQKE